MRAYGVDRATPQARGHRRRQPSQAWTPRHQPPGSHTLISSCSSRSCPHADSDSGFGLAVRENPQPRLSALGRASRSRVRLFLGHLCSKWPGNPSVAWRVCAQGGARAKAGLRHIVSGSGGTQPSHGGSATTLLREHQHGPRRPSSCPSRRPCSLPPSLRCAGASPRTVPHTPEVRSRLGRLCVVPASSSSSSSSRSASAAHQPNDKCRIGNLCVLHFASPHSSSAKLA